MPISRLIEDAQIATGGVCCDGCGRGQNFALDIPEAQIVKAPRGLSFAPLYTKALFVVRGAPVTDSEILQAALHAGWEEATIHQHKFMFCPQCKEK